MTTQEKTQLHCGACGTPFNNIHKLNTHIETCPAAQVILPYVYQSFNNLWTGHPFSHWVQRFYRSQDLIKQYAYSISSGTSNMMRSEIHAKLCDSLGIKYHDFRPFESGNIKEVPSYDDAQRILWEALCAYSLREILGIPSKDD